MISAAIKAALATHTSFIVNNVINPAAIPMAPIARQKRIVSREEFPGRIPNNIIIIDITITILAVIRAFALITSLLVLFIFF